MATRALIRPRSRTWVAAALLVGALAVLLVAWFFSGWADVRAQQRELRAEPSRTAERKAAGLASELRIELTRLAGREAERPYFHYQNLFHDPRTGPGNSVATSPLAAGPQDPLVLGYFHRDPSGKVTTPTVNDEAPHLSEPTRLAENRQFRDEVIRSFSAALADSAPQLASVETPPTKVARVQSQRAQVVELDPRSYAQNAAPNAVYLGNLEGVEAPPAQQTLQRPTSGPVTITISPFEWRTLTYANQPALVALRHVATPDGTLAQGFVVDPSTLTSWLASRAGDSVAELAAREAGGAHEIAPGWQLTVAANPRVLAAAAGAASDVARTFLVKFVLIGLVAGAAAMFVVMLVARAERLARERSQFAAAAAHELRTPLAGLQLYGDMLADGLGDPTKVRDYARRMSEEASRLGRVVSNVLGFSQLERGNLSVQVEDGPLGIVLAEIAERAEPALERAGALLALDVSPDLRARYDRDAVLRIVGNLLDNAEKYGRGAEDRTIELAGRATPNGVEVTVTDRGPGVAHHARAKLFQAFSRGVDSDGPAGLGLGLALSQSLARAMGGELEYRARDDGATFVLQLARA
ncbi:MAG TPA: HAMP domain-containing sensor histidine kinase [Kofleriaceae bacterium]|nr:HAMP domain-containing sensor histidine kinase [Kofleriaceae bacterium]